MWYKTYYTEEPLINSVGSSSPKMLILNIIFNPQRQKLDTVFVILPKLVSNQYP
jgi:hypothetical protein